MRTITDVSFSIKFNGNEFQRVSTFDLISKLWITSNVVVVELIRKWTCHLYNHSLIVFNGM